MLAKDSDFPTHGMAHQWTDFEGYQHILSATKFNAEQILVRHAVTYPPEDNSPPSETFLALKAETFDIFAAFIALVHSDISNHPL